jgi:hypothetical protein
MGDEDSMEEFEDEAFNERPMHMYQAVEADTPVKGYYPIASVPKIKKFEEKV